MSAMKRSGPLLGPTVSSSPELCEACDAGEEPSSPVPLKHAAPAAL